MPNLVNRMIVREYTDEFKDATGMVLVDLKGLSVAESERLRDLLAEKGVSFRVLRNKLARRVLAERGVEIDAEVMTGNTALAWGNAEDAIAAAKVFTDPEIKKLRKVKIKAGLLEGETLGAADAQGLADVPDRDTLNAQLLGVISGPARSLVSLLNAVPASVARVLQAHADAEGDDQ